MFDYFGGLDFSGAKEPLATLWSTVGCERNGKLHVVDLRPHPFRDDAAHFITDGCRKRLGAEPLRCLWGLDFPFSLPRGAAAELCEEDSPTWERIIDWVGNRPPEDVYSAAGAWRKVTRQVDVGAAMAPLDLRIHKQTVRGMRFLDALVRESGVSVVPLAPRDGAAVTLIEVYPSITAADLNITGRRPRQAGQVRARPEQLAAYLTFEHPAMEATAVTLEDAWDATLACLTAYLVREDMDQPRRVARVPRKVVQREGWIYRHPDAA